MCLCYLSASCKITPGVQWTMPNAGHIVFPNINKFVFALQKTNGSFSWNVGDKQFYWVLNVPAFGLIANRRCLCRCWNNTPGKSVKSHKTRRSGEKAGYPSRRTRKRKCMDKHFLPLGQRGVQRIRVWGIKPWKYNSLLVANTICQECWWAHQESEDTLGIAHTPHCSLVDKLSVCVNPQAMIGLLCQPVMEYNSLTMAVWGDLVVDKCVFFPHGQKDFRCWTCITTFLSLHSLIQAVNPDC